MQKGSIFSDISPAEWERILHCFQPITQKFEAGSYIMTFSEDLDRIGIMLSGKAHLTYIDADGKYTILEQLYTNDVFGEVFSLPLEEQEFTVQAITDCEIMFLSYDHLVKPCSKACAHHSQMIQNMFRLVAEKASALSERVEVLSRRSIRDKLLCYFAIQAGRCGGCFTIPFSLSTLADYISADRSAMMRELKKMREAGLVEVHGRQVCVLQ